MKLLTKPTLEFEELIICENGKPIVPNVWVAGSHKWLPMEVKLDFVNELPLGKGKLGNFEDDYCKLEGVMLIDINYTTLIGTIHFDHAHIKYKE